MEIILAAAALLAISVVVLWLRLHRLDQDRRDALAHAGRALGSTPGSLTGAVDSLAGERDAARHRTAFIEAAVERSSSGVVMFDRNLDAVFATAGARRVLAGGAGAAEAGAALRRLVQATLVSGEPGEAKLELTGEDRRLYVARAEPLPVELGPGVAVQLEDVTTSERVEAIRRDFVANVSHELKTPAGALAVLAEAVQAAPDEITRLRLADRIGTEAQRIAQLVADLLDLSVVQSQNGEHEHLDLAEVVGEAARNAGLHAEQARMEVVVETDGAPLVRGDRRQLVSAVGNLIDNAITYSSFRESGERRVWVRARADGEQAVIEVEDLGSGIAPAHLPRIFERFYRVDRGRSRAKGGTGLGLSIVRHVALNHGGHVDVESSPGVGSTFRIHMPRVEA